jgi:branched-chain amino acid transport system permease protein
MELGFLVGSIVKIGAILAYLYGLLWVLGHKQLWVKVVGIVAAFAIIQIGLTVSFGEEPILNDFDSGLIFQAASMTMVALGLNLIYGFNGQFSLGQWGFYGIGAYTAADITFRWINGDSRGLIVVGLGTILGGLMILGINRWLSKFKGVPVLSAFAFYLVGSLLVGVIAVGLGNALNPSIAPLLGNTAAPGPLSQGVWLQIVFFLSVIFAGIFAAATLGFTIVVNTLMVNSDTILPFPEMKGGRGMIGIPKLTTWFWAFFFMLLVIVIMRNIIQSSTGRTILSVREDETAAKAMGIDIANTKLLAFVIGSLFAGIGGGVYAHYIGFLSPKTFDFLPGFNPLIIVVFGGLGSMTGTIAASFGWIFFLEGLLRVLLSQLGTEAPTWRFVFYPIALLLLMLIRPQGLLGNVEWGFLKAPIVKAKELIKKSADIINGQ